MARGESSEAFDGVHVPKRTRRLFLAVSLLTLAVYLVSARGVPQTFDEQIVFDTTAALVHGHAAIKSTSVSAAEFKEFPGLSVHRSDGSRAGIYGIGTSAVGAPFYVIGKVVAEMSPPENRAQIMLTATMFTDALITAAAVFMLMLVCMLLGAPPPGAVIVGLSFGLGSYAFPHALTLFTEPGTALCVIAAVYFAIRAARRGARADLLACGAWAGAALLFRVSAALFLPVIGAVAPRSRRGVGRARIRPRVRRMVEFGAWYTAGAVGPLLVMLAVNSWRYGSVTNFGYALGDATDQSYPILRGVVNQWFSSGKSVFLYAPARDRRGVRARAFREANADGDGAARQHRGGEHAVLRAGAVLVGRLGVGPALPADRDPVPRGDGGAADGFAGVAASAHRRERARVCLFAALPAVLVRFTPLWYAAYTAMPPPTILGPKVWDHSYYALVWHTWHWQPILYQLRSLPNALSNSCDHVTSPLGPNPLNRRGDPALAERPALRVLVAARA